MIGDLLTECRALADCTRRQVGAALVLDGTTVGVGWNRLLNGSCTGGDCPRGRQTYAERPAASDYTGNCEAEHAEAAALRQAGDNARGAVCYVTCEPCQWCAAALDAAGVSQVVIIPPESNR